MRLADLAPEDRPRERLLRLGASALSDAELLALFLRTGVCGEDVLTFAARVLREADGLAGLFAHDARALEGVRGIGPAKRAELRAVIALAQRYLASALTRPEAIRDPSHAADYFALNLRDRPQEVFAAAFLDTRHRVVAFEELFHGTIDGASVHPREVVRRAIHHRAAAVIVAHNHPSGVAEPSAADISVTRRLREALALVEVRLLDHFIVGEGRPLSLAARGLL
ncbi:MAG TPA: DNA repair protein RadC [Patescibacteria group bacterium]|nr:DNA repair protein RadC [Patescibacteria group bacterium]